MGNRDMMHFSLTNGDPENCRWYLAWYPRENAGGAAEQVFMSARYMIQCRA